MILRLAVLNLARNTRRTVLSLGAVVAGVWVLIVGRSFIAGIVENIVRTQIDTVAAHVLVRPADYPTEGLQHPVDDLLVVDDALGKHLDATAVAWTPRLAFAPRAVHGPLAMRVRAVGFDPATDPATFPRDRWTVEGAVPERAADGVLVGAGLGRLLDLAPGDRVVLQVRTSAGALNALDVPVAGLVRVNNPMLDRVGMLVPMDLAQDLVQAHGRVSHVHVRLRDRSRAEAYAADLRGPVGAAEVRGYVEDIAPMLRMQQIRQRALDILVFALLGMSAASIANTVLMAAYERVREVGTLRALGMTEGEVVRLFLVEGALMGLAGSLVGGALGAGMVLYWSANGIDLAGSMEKVATNVPFSTTLYARFDLPTVLLAMAFGVGVAVLASIVPARVASRMAPADAVRA